jgi:hypothetical protein
MNTSVRGLICVAAVTLGGVAMGAQTMLPSGSAGADVCTQVGNNATVTTCADLSDIVVQIVTPGRPDRELGNLAPNLQTCLGWDGIWVYADSCT